MFSKSGLTWCVVTVVFACPNLVHAQQFTGTSNEAAHLTEYNMRLHLQGNQYYAPTTWAARSNNVTLDVASQTIVYNSLALSTSAPITTTLTIDEIPPDTFDTVRTTATVSIDPISITATNVGPLDLYNQGAYLDIELSDGSFWSGDHGSFPDLLLTGTYNIERGVDKVSGVFSLALPIYRLARFLNNTLYVNDYPNAISLHAGLSNTVLWFDEGQFGNVIPKTIYSDTLGGFDCTLELWDAQFRQLGSYSQVDSGVMLTAIPEPSALVLLGIGAVGLLAYAWRWRRLTLGLMFLRSTKGGTKGGHKGGQNYYW